MADAGGERLVLTTPRRSLILAAAVCAAMAVLGLWYVSVTDDFLVRLWSQLGIFLLVVGVISAMIGLRKPPQLILTPEGFTLTGMASPGLIGWSEVEAFRVYEEASDEDGQGGVAPHAAWVLHEDAPARDRLISKINRQGGLPIDGSLPLNIGMKPEPLAALMESWRVRYG